VPAPAEPIDTVVFDLGGVLFDWNPRHLYRNLIGDSDRMEWFLGAICSPEWNERQDAGRSFAEGIAELVARHPEHEALIRAYDERWTEMLAGPIAGTVEILEQLARRGVPLYALTNWSRDKFPFARAHPFMDRFAGIVISGHEGIKKPDPRMWQILEERHRVQPPRSVYIDDVPANLAAARARGYATVLFSSPAALASELGQLGLLP
jgi:2-haloacid dehalogenase